MSYRENRKALAALFNLSVTVCALMPALAFAQASGLYSFDRYFPSPAQPARPGAPPVPMQQRSNVAAQGQTLPAAAVPAVPASQRRDSSAYQLGPDLKLTGSLGLEYHKFSYKESSLNVEEKGSFLGAVGDIGLRYRDWFSRVEGRAAFGSVDYTGSGTILGIRDHVFEGRLLGGYRFKVSDLEIAPYTGYGYRRLIDYLGYKVSTTNARGYDRISQYNYIPVGIEFGYPVYDGWAVRPGGEYDVFISGTQESKLSQVNAAISDLENKQTKGYGIRGQLLASKRFESGASLDLGPYIRYWDINASDIKTITVNGAIRATGQEPANKTIETGVTVRYRWD